MKRIVLMILGAGLALALAVSWQLRKGSSGSGSKASLAASLQTARDVDGATESPVAICDPKLSSPTVCVPKLGQLCECAWSPTDVEARAEANLDCHVLEESPSVGGDAPPEYVTVASVPNCGWKSTEAAKRADVCPSYCDVDVVPSDDELADGPVFCHADASGIDWRDCQDRTHSSSARQEAP